MENAECLNNRRKFDSKLEWCKRVMMVTRTCKTSLKSLEWKENVQKAARARQCHRNRDMKRQGKARDLGMPEGFPDDAISMVTDTSSFHAR